MEFKVIANMPGYLPDSDSPPPSFESFEEARDYLACELSAAADAEYDSEGEAARFRENWFDSAVGEVLGWNTPAPLWESLGIFVAGQVYEIRTEE